MRENIKKDQEIVWQPTHPQKSQLWAFIQTINEENKINIKDYSSLYQWSIQYPEKFWSKIATFFNLKFTTPATDILKPGKHFTDYQWFHGATLNFAEHLLQTNNEAPAIIAINELNQQQHYSFKQLHQAVADFRQGLIDKGIKTSDRVAGIMPNIPQTIIAMLATASIGAIWSSCSPDFGVQAIVDRLGQIKPVLLIITDGYTYQGKMYSNDQKISDLLTQIPCINTLVVYSYLHCEYPNHPKITSWDDFVVLSHTLSFVPLPFDHPLYILYSSGTTGKPKCIIHSAGGTLLQHLKELALHTDLSAADRLCFFTTCGWMMWNWMVSALALGTCLVLYEGSPTYPNPGRLLQLIEEQKITVFGTSAKYLSMLEKSSTLEKNTYSLKHLKTILSTGSPLLPQHYDFVYKKISSSVQLSSISGGTDIISCFALGNPILPIYKGELQCIGLGMDVAIFDPEGKAVVEQQGELVCRQPFPSMPIGFWNDPNNTAYHHAYFQRFKSVWAHGDFAKISAHGGLTIYGRSDAVLNPGGVRIGTAEIYRQIETIPEILESIVVGQPWQDDVRIVLFVKLKPGKILTDALINTIRQTIRQNASPRHVPAKILQVDDIPHTMSGKIVELAVRDIICGKKINNIEAIANPQSLVFFENRVELNT